MDTQVAKQNLMKKVAQTILKMDNLDNFLNSLTQMIIEVLG